MLSFPSAAVAAAAALCACLLRQSERERLISCWLLLLYSGTGITDLKNSSRHENSDPKHTNIIASWAPPVQEASRRSQPAAAEGGKRRRATRRDCWLWAQAKTGQQQSSRLRPCACGTGYFFPVTPTLGQEEKRALNYYLDPR